MLQPNRIIQGDCIEILRSGNVPPIDLVFADPPFNIGYKYDVYRDRKKYDEYFDWTYKWMEACRDVLKEDGSMWVAIGDEYAAEVRIIGRRLGLNLRNWIIWHYTFGQNTKRKFARSHAHIFYWTKHQRKFTFNDDAVRVPSARQTTYKDKRANPKGKVPDDVWSFSRLCGTFNERVGWHPCQMPVKLLERIIAVSSNSGDLVLDPFSGSGTTCLAAERLKRKYLGIDLSDQYAQKARERIESMWGCEITNVAENPVEKRRLRNKNKSSKTATKSLFK